jgi:hypothetical protein
MLAGIREGCPMAHPPSEVVQRFRNAVSELDGIFPDDRLTDENVESELRQWLDGTGPPLAWTFSGRVTPDEWFFITTLYGKMTLDGQRTHIRKYFPMLFVGAVNHDIRNFVPSMPEYAGLRTDWMPRRLTRMAEILRLRNQSMAEYAEGLKRLESLATPTNPMPALDAIRQDHKATSWKTLSVFVRDCIGGNCFPIDSRVQKELERHRLPAYERHLVSLSLEIGRNPRQVERMFYRAGGQRGGSKG